jgi:dihydropyrimidinase
MKKILRNGTLVTASDTYKADILIDGEVISMIGQNLQDTDAQVIDASGKYIFPGGIDPHTHFDLPMFGTVSSDDHYTGNKAAAFGGTTTVMDFVVQEKGGFQKSLDLWYKKAEKSAIDHSFHMNLTHFDDEVAKELPVLINNGVTTLKVFTAYNGRLRLDDRNIFKALIKAKEHGMLVMVHCENGDIIEELIPKALAAGNTSPAWHAYTRPKWGAVESTMRMCAMAQQADAPVYIVHMNAGGEANMLQYSRERDVKVMGETCPPYLFFSTKHMERPDGAKWICSPPMRDEEDNQRLWEALSNNTLQTIGTDHCPFFFDGTKAIQYEGKSIAIPGKELGKDNFTQIPNGLPGVQDRLPILWSYGVRTGKITMNQFVAYTSTNPAKIFGLYPRKGALVPGADADIVIWDPNKEMTYGVANSHQRTDYNLYEGWKIVGYPEKVLLRGEVIVDGENWLGKVGGGKYLKRTEGLVI